MELYEKNEFTGAVNRIIEDMNHRFLISVLTRDFKSHDTNQICALQYKHLTDPEKIARTEHEYGEITKRVVLYRGKDVIVEDVEYKNVVAYLAGLDGYLDGC